MSSTQTTDPPVVVIKPGRLPMDTLVTAEEFSAAYELDAETLARWITEGAPVKQREGLKLIHVREFFEWFCKTPRKKRTAPRAP